MGLKRQANRFTVQIGLSFLISFFVEEAFGQMGLEYVPTAANFIMLRVGNGSNVFNALQRLGVSVRPMGGYQLGEWIRISAGTLQENERCLNALSAALA